MERSTAPSTRTAAGRPPGARRGGGGGGRHRLPPRVGEPRPRTPRPRPRPRGAPGRRGVALERRAARLPGVRALDGHRAQRAGPAPRRPIRRKDRVGPRGARGRGSVLRDEVERRDVLAPRGDPRARPHGALRPRRGGAWSGVHRGGGRVRDLIAIDMGGTSADVSLVRDAAPSVTKDGEIGPFPSRSRWWTSTPSARGAEASPR